MSKIKRYPELKPQVKQIVEEELGEVVDEFPFGRFSDHFTCKVKLRNPIRVHKTTEKGSLLFNSATHTLLGLPLWLSIHIYSTVPKRHEWKLNPIADKDTEIYLDIRLCQDEDFFWRGRGDYGDYEKDATAENLIKEIRLAVAKIRENGICPSGL